MAVYPDASGLVALDPETLLLEHLGQASIIKDQLRDYAHWLRAP